jgi:hypothetical protein
MDRLRNIVEFRGLGKSGKGLAEMELAGAERQEPP